MNLDNLDYESKTFISNIVDGYVKGKEHIKSGSNPYIDNPGMMVNNIFTTFSGKWIYNVIFHILEDSKIEIYYIFSKSLIQIKDGEEEYDAIERLIKIIRSEIVHKISILQLLKDSGHIFFVDDKNCNFFNSGKVTQHDKERWNNNGIKYYRDELKSKVLYEFLSQFSSSLIIPSPQLIDFRNNNFRTVEDRRFEEQHRLSENALKIARCSNIIAIVIGIISLLATCIITKCSSTKINEAQFLQIIETINNNNNNG